MAKVVVWLSERENTDCLKAFVSLHSPSLLEWTIQLPLSGHTVNSFGDNNKKKQTKANQEIVWTKITCLGFPTQRRKKPDSHHDVP